jgi:hypothetical protein
VTGTPVEIGIRDSSRVEILSGLNPGARVVRAGHQKLYPGAHVMPIPEGGMGGAPGADAKPAGDAKPAAGGAQTVAAPPAKTSAAKTPAAKGGGTK